MVTDMPKTLILGTSYLGPEAQNYGARVLRLWAKLTRHLNPETPILVIDSKSPIDPAPILADHGIECWSFLDNIGHLNLTGRDGWGRAMSKGIEMAIERGYEWIAYMDVDIIFVRPVGPIIDKMARFGVKAACPMDSTYQFLENGITFLNVEYLRDSKFVERYDWASRKPISDISGVPEVAFERLTQDAIFTLPLRGLRDDFARLTTNNLVQAFPYGVDYLTHCRDFAIYERFIEMQGIKL